MKENKVFKLFDKSVFFHFIGRQLYNIFVPILLLKNGYSLTLVLLFLIFSSLVTIFTSYISQRKLKHEDTIRFNIFAILSEIFLLALFFFSEFSLTVFVLIFIFEGFYYSFYYMSYFSIINHYTSIKNIGKNIGNLSIAVNLSTILAPLIGALLLDMSKIYLISASIIFLLVSLIPLIRIANVNLNKKKEKKIKLKDIKYELFDYSMMGALEMVIFVLWGLYAYVSGLSLLSIGFIPVASSIANIALANKIKTKLSDKKFRRAMELLSIIGLVLISFYRFVWPGHILFTNLAVGFLFLGFYLSVQTAMFEKLKNHRAYHSSMLLSVTTFSTRLIILIAVFAVGLKYSILIPILLLPLYLISLKMRKK